jgi:hypothetical protein
MISMLTLKPFIFDASIAQVNIMNLSNRAPQYYDREQNAYLEVLRALGPSMAVVFGFVALVGVALVLVARPGRRFIGVSILGLGTLGALAVYFTAYIIRENSYDQDLDAFDIVMAYGFATIGLCAGAALIANIGELIEAACKRNGNDIPTSGKVVSKDHVKEENWLMPAGNGVLIPMHTPESWKVTLRGDDGYQWTVETTSQAFSRVQIGSTFNMKKGDLNA